MHHVIVGGGVAGITAAMDLSRSEGNEVDVYSDEEYPYYYRPQLTEFLAGTLTMNELLRRPLSWYEGRGITIHLGHPVVGLDVGQKTLTTENGEQVTYDKLLLAMGSVPFLPPIDGIDKQGVRTWRTLEDTLEMEKIALSCSKIVVIGGGLLGLEAARGLKTFCANVTVLEFFPRLMPRQLDSEGSLLLESFVQSLGIKTVVGAHTKAFEGDDYVTGVRLEDGTHFPAGTVLIAAGVRPCTPLAATAGIAVEHGIIVDEYMQTSAPDVYAAGDVAEFRGYSWAIAPIARAQGRNAATNMAGNPTPYDVVVPSTTLKVIGIDVSSVGLVNPEAEEYVEIRHLDEEARTYKKIVLHEGLIVGSIVINDKDLARELEKQIAARTAMTEEEARAIVKG